MKAYASNSSIPQELRKSFGMSAAGAEVYLDVVGSRMPTEPRIRARQALLPEVGIRAEGLLLLCCKILCRAACVAVDSPPPQVLL